MFLVDWLRLTRWRDWFQSKLPFITAAALLLTPQLTQPLKILQVMGTVLLWAAFGYGVNEVFDRGGDARAGKRNRAAAVSRGSWISFILMTAGGALVLCSQWAADAAAPGFLLGGLALAVAYSAPPLRLKERGTWGLLGSAAAQWSIPILAVSAVEAGGWLRPAAWSVAFLGLAIGVRWVAVHQLKDASADRRANVHTYATQAHIEPAIVGAFLSECVALTAALILTWPSSRPAIIAFALWALWRTLLRSAPGSFRMRLGTFEEAPLAEYYFLFLPLALALSLTSSSRGSLGIAALLLLSGAPHVYRMIREWRLRRPFLARG